MQSDKSFRAEVITILVVIVGAILYGAFYTLNLPKKYFFLIVFVAMVGWSVFNYYRNKEVVDILVDNFLLQYKHYKASKKKGVKK